MDDFYICYYELDDFYGLEKNEYENIKNMIENGQIDLVMKTITNDDFLDDLILMTSKYEREMAPVFYKIADLLFEYDYYDEYLELSNCIKEGDIYCTRVVKIINDGPHNLLDKFLENEQFIKLKYFDLRHVIASYIRRSDVNIDTFIKLLEYSEKNYTYYCCISVINNKVEILKYLINLYNFNNKQEEEILIDCIKYNKSEILKYLLSKFSYNDYDKLLSFVYSTSNITIDSKQIIDILLKKGVRYYEYNIYDKWMCTEIKIKIKNYIQIKKKEIYDSIFKEMPNEIINIICEYLNEKFGQIF